MKVSTKKITREKFVEATNMAHNVINNLFPNTRLAFYCEKFLELNKKEQNIHSKKIKSATRELTLEIDCFKALQCVEKDGKLCRTPDGHYEYDRKGEIEILKKQTEIEDKVNEIIDDILTEEVLVKCAIDEVVLPKDGITYELISALNGYAFKNKSEFEEEIEEITEEEKTV